MRFMESSFRNSFCCFIFLFVAHFTLFVANQNKCNYHEIVLYIPVKMFHISHFLLFRLFCCDVVQFLLIVYLKT